MSLSTFREQAKTVLDAVAALDVPIRQLSGSEWSQVIDRSASDSSPLGDLGDVTLGGSVAAAAHLTKSADPPLDLGDLAGDPGEAQTAWASYVVSANGSASLATSRTPRAGATITAGVDANGNLALAHHRSFSQAKNALAALVDLAGDLRLPYGLRQPLPSGDVLEVVLGGSVALRADAAWTAGFVQEIRGAAIDALELSQPVSIDAGVTVGLTVSASLKGDLRVTVRPDASSTVEQPRVRVALAKGKTSFVGAGLTIDVGIDFTNVAAFVDAVFAKVLAIPDRLVADLRDVEQQLADLESRLAGLQSDAKAEIAEAAGKAANALDLDDLQELAGKVGELPEPVQQALEPFTQGVAKVSGLLASIQSELASKVDAAFATVGRPLEDVQSTLGKWLAAYDDLRAKARNFVVERAQQGIKAELSAGINRSRASDALLDLRFDLANDAAARAYDEAVRGDYQAALLLARAPGANGVELVSGTLKETVRTDRSFGLQVNLFGFDVRRTLTAWNESSLETDLATGSLTLAGQAGAKLAGKFGQQVRDLKFLFEVAGAAEKRDGKIFLADPSLAYTASLSRTSTLSSDRAIATALPLHVAGAQALVGLAEADATALRDRLAAQSGTYELTLDLSFPAAAVQRIFHFDLASDKEAQLVFWNAFVQAVDRLDVPIQSGQDFVPLSRFLTLQVFQEIADRPTAAFIVKEFRAPRVPGFKLQGGAERLIGAYALEGVVFVSSLVGVRKSLGRGEPAAAVAKDLREMAQQTASTIGFGSTKPLDAKYLTLALLAGTSAVDVSYRFQRGDVDVRL